MTDLAKLGLFVDSTGVVRATDHLGKFGKEGQRAEGIAGKFGKTGKAAFGAVAVAAAGAVSAIASIGGAVSVIRQFETSMSQVAAITGATKGELEALRDVAKDLGSTTEFSAAQAADGLRFLGMAGFNAAESMKAIPAVLDLATASSMGLAESADIASNVLSGFGLAAGDAAQVADVLAAASSRSNTSVSQLGGAMSTVAPIAAALDISLQDTAAAIGVMSDAGIQGERAGTALRGVLASLAGPTDAAADALSRYGLSVADVDPATRSLTEIFGVLQERGLSTADAMEIFGREAASGALVLTEASGRVGEFGGELRGAEGAASDMAGIMRDNLGGAANTLMSTVQGLAIALGEAGLTAVLIAALEGVTALVRGITSLVEIGGKLVGWVSTLFDFRDGLTDIQKASDLANLAIADQVAQHTALTRALEDGRTMSLDYAGAMLENAKASLAAADASRERRLEEVKSTEAYQELIEQQIAANRQISDLQNLFNGGEVSAELRRMADASLEVNGNLDGMLSLYQSTLEKLQANVAEQRLMTGSVEETNEEALRLEGEIRLLEAAIAAAKDGTVVLGAETSDAADTTAALARLSGEVDFDSASAAARGLAASLSGAAAQARVLVANLGFVPTALGSLAEKVASQVESMTIANASLRDQIDNGTSASIAAIKAERDVLLNRMEIEGADMVAQAEAIKRFDDKIATLETLTETNETLTGSLAGVTTATTSAGGATKSMTTAVQSAIDKLQEQIRQERDLIGLADDATAEIEARRQVEDALAQDKLDWNDQAIQGLTDQIMLNRELREEAEQTSRVLRTIFDGLAKGDLGSIGSGLLNMAQQSFSGLLSDSFAKGGGGLSNLWKSISGGFSNIGANYSSAGGGLAGIGSAISGLLPGIGAISSIVGVVQSVIGTTTKLTNALEGTLGIGGLLRGTEYDIKQNDSLFGSKTEKNSEEIFGSWAGLIAQDLDEEFRGMVQNTRDGIRALGLDINEAFTYDFDVQFDESLPHEQLMERLRQELNNANDELLRTSLAAAGLARDGETGAQTLLILNDSLRTANASLRLLDQALFDVSAIGAGAARELIEMSGGMDAFAGKTTFVFDNFLTTAEQDARALAIANENLAQTFDQLVGISIPETHAQFMALLDAQDLTTAAGRETYAALIDVADEFVTVNDSVQDLLDKKLAEELEAQAKAAEEAADAARELAAIDRERAGLMAQLYRLTGDENALRQMQLDSLHESNHALQQQIWGIEDANEAAADAKQAASEALRNAETALRDAFSAEADRVRAAYQDQIDAAGAAADAARDMAEAALQTAQERVQLRQSIADALERAYQDRRVLDALGARNLINSGTAFLRAAVGAGGTSDLLGLKKALDAVANPSTALFGSFEEYQQDFNVNTNLISQLKDLNAGQLSIEQRALQAVEDTVDAVSRGATLQVAAITSARDAQLLALDAQMNALLGINTSVLSVEQAITNLAAAQGAVAQTADSVSASINSGTGNAVTGSVVNDSGIYGLSPSDQSAITNAYMATFGEVPHGAFTTWGRAINRDGMSLNQAVSKIYGFAGMSAPSYANGTDFHLGGPAITHSNELITVPNMPRGTSVSTSGEIREMVNEIKALRQSNAEMAVELRQIRRFAQSRTDIVEEKRAEELAGITP